jgi:hypothetical protein
VVKPIVEKELNDLEPSGGREPLQYDVFRRFLGLNVEDEVFVYGPHHAGPKLVGG